MGVPCIMCRSEIAEGARFCPHCEQYQSSWRNWLLYFGTVIGLFSIAGSALIWTYSSMKRAVSRDQLVVVSVHSPINIVLQNPGYKAIFVESLEIRPDAAPRTAWEHRGLNKVVPPRDVAAFNFDGGLGEEEGGVHITVTSEQELKSLKASTQTGEVTTHFYDAESQILAGIKERMEVGGEKLATQGATGYLSYRVVDEVEQRQIEVPLVGTYLRPRKERSP